MFWAQSHQMAAELVELSAQTELREVQAVAREWAQPPHLLVAQAIPHQPHLHREPLEVIQQQPHHKNVQQVAVAVRPRQLTHRFREPQQLEELVQLHQLLVHLLIMRAAAVEAQTIHRDLQGPAALGVEAQAGRLA